MPAPKFDIVFGSDTPASVAVPFEKAVKAAIEAGYEAGKAGKTHVPAVVLTVPPTLSAESIAHLKGQLVKAAEAGHAAGAAEVAPVAAEVIEP